MRSIRLSTIIILAFTMTFTACGTGGGGGDSSGSSDAAVVPSNGATLSHKDEITVTFKQPVDTGSYTIDGDLAAEGDGGEWISSDTLRLRPSSINGWTQGSWRTLTVCINDLEGNPISPISLSYNVIKRIVYVSSPANSIYGNGGDDGNAGTQDTPKATINAAIASLAVAGYTGDVYVAQGTYEVEYQLGTHVRLVEGISLYGGYLPTDWGERDTESYVSTITDTSSTGGTGSNENRAIYAGDGISNLTVVDGFSINGGAGESSSAVIVEAGGAPVIQNNTINGGNGDLYSCGILTDSSSPIIQRNNIHGGSGWNVSDGISNFSSSPVIKNNVINGGNGISSNGIYNYDSSLDIESNNIDGGSGSDQSYGILNSDSSPSITNNIISGGYGSVEAYGILISELSGGTIIRNNTIEGGSGANISYGIFIFGMVSPIIENNIVFTADLSSSGNYCLYETNASSDPVSVRNNNFFSCSTALYADYVGTGGNCTLDASRDCLTTAVEVNGLMDASIGDNISAGHGFEDIDGPDNDITTMDDNDWHLTASSPESVKTGGIDGASLDENWGFNTDIDGVIRSGNNITGWSMGAYEY